MPTQLTNPEENLGNLKKVDLREAWSHEAINFTQWLAQEDNIQLLAWEIGTDISLRETESSVGDFNVDILAQTGSANEEIIIIENQLEDTDHDHLGKIITYAAGHDASTIIWVTKSPREEHRQAIDWLNEHTSASLNFFLVQIELWQIDDSPYAPKFEIISQPNDWTSTLREQTSERLSDTRYTYWEFWSGLKDYAAERGTTLSLPKPHPQLHRPISIGYSQSDMHLNLLANLSDNTIGTELYLKNREELFDRLWEHKDNLEQKLGAELDWYKMEGKKASRIQLIRHENIDEVSKQNEYFEWLLENAERFAHVFPQYIEALKEE